MRRANYTPTTHHIALCSSKVETKVLQLQPVTHKLITWLQVTIQEITAASIVRDEVIANLQEREKENRK